MKRCCLWLALLLVIASAGAPARASDPLAQRRAVLDAAFREKSEEIAAKCDELGLPEQARLTRAWAAPRDPSRYYVFLPAPEARPPENAPSLVRFWYDAWRKARTEYAKGLFPLAQAALDEGRLCDSLTLIYETLHFDPTHVEALRILGSPANEAPRAKPVRTRHPRFGWAPGQSWRVESAHYDIRTNHSADEGIRLASRLEQLYTAWRQVFAEYWLTEADLRRALEGGALPPPARRKLQVVIFRDRDEYLEQLRAAHPQIGLSEGYYAPQERIAFFYGGEESSETTWRHEGTHQILYELGDTAPRAGLSANFWAIEAAALYMESLALEDGRGAVGGFDAERLQYARFRALSQDAYTPLAELVSLGRDDFQQHPEIRRLYTQSAGLAHFFFHGQQGQYRRPFLRYLAAVHQGRDRKETLAELLETDFATLDRQYREFLNVTDADLAAAQPPAGISMLSLGGTDVTDAGLAYLSRYPRLTWLNLAGARVTDAGIQHLAQHKELEELYLTGTAVSDAGLRALEGLTRLKMLDTAGSRITDAGWRRMKQLLPELKPAE